MGKTYEVELSIIKKYEVKVLVAGEFSGIEDPDLEKEAMKAADYMGHGSWGYIDTGFEIDNVTEVKQSDGNILIIGKGMSPEDFQRILDNAPKVDLRENEALPESLIPRSYIASKESAKGEL